MTASAELVVETAWVPMRDGVVLATDIYRDSAVSAGPVVLTRTPYDRTKQKATAERWVKAGYHFVAQDCRGKFASGGVMAPYNGEGQDGYDTLEWITRQAWCNGRIATTGSSYVGGVQWQAAVENPPGLVAMAPQATWSSFYRNIYLGGSVRLALIASWLAGNAPKPEGAQSGDLGEAFMRLPLTDVDEAMGWSIPWLDAFLSHPEPNGFWTRLDLTSRLPELRLPVLHVVGYYDYFSRESVGNFVVMQQQAKDPAVRKHQRLILGPWDHGSVGKTKVGDVEFGTGAAIDLVSIQHDWFDRHLKLDREAQSKPFPPVQYFSMGDNVWKTAETWPPEGFKPTEFYLHSAGNANSSKGHGRIDRRAPKSDEPSDAFRADPQNPVPACPVTEVRPMKAAIWGPVNQAVLEEREDVLVYTSEVLEEPLAFAGNLEAKLHVSTDTPDADWVVKVVDVHPDGFAQNLVSGIQRGRYRNSLLKPELMESGKVVEITVDLGPCAATLGKGHRLRVDICGSLFPLHDRNPNTDEGIFGSRTAVARESVHHRPGALSRLILPIR